MKLGERITVTIDRNKWARLVARFVDSGTAQAVVRDGLVNRSKGQWPLLLSSTGTMCCLGFISKALLLKSGMAEDVADRVLLNRSMPSSIGTVHSVYRELAASWREQVDKALELLRKPLSPNSEGGSVAWLNSELAKIAASVNDLSFPDSSDPEFLHTREERLVEMFAPFGIDLVFEGEKDPVYEVPHIDTPGAVGTPDLRPGNEDSAELQQP